MFNKNECVVVKRNNGSTHSGRVIKQIDDNHYKVAYIHNGYMSYSESFIIAGSPASTAKCSWS